MVKLFEIASSITNPISLTALFFLILYLLYKGVIAKIGPQKGIRGYQLLKQLMSTVAVIAIVTLILVFGFKAYQVYSKVDEVPELNEIIDKIDLNQNQINKSTDSIVKETSEIKTQIEQSNNSLIKKIDSTSHNIEKNTEIIIREVKKEELTVQFFLAEYTGGNLLIGNNGGKIILMKNLKIHWDYLECLQYEEPKTGVPLVVYRYEVSITKENGTKLIAAKEFKYGAGEIDKFLVDINYPGLGIYTVWFSFEYNIFGSDEWFLYKTEKDSIEKCIKRN